MPRWLLKYFCIAWIAAFTVIFFPWVCLLMLVRWSSHGWRFTREIRAEKYFQRAVLAERQGDVALKISTPRAAHDEPMLTRIETHGRANRGRRQRLPVELRRRGDARRDDDLELGHA